MAHILCLWSRPPSFTSPSLVLLLKASEKWRKGILFGDSPTSMDFDHIWKVNLATRICHTSCIALFSLPNLNVAIVLPQFIIHTYS